MPGPTQQTDHESVALALLPQQFSDSPNLRALIAAMIGPSLPTTWGIQDLENVYFEILEDRWLSTATGQQLDNLGILVGLARTSASDTEYRDALRVQIAINCSQGDPERLISITDDISAPAGVHYLQKGEASMVLAAITATRTSELWRIPAACPAGVTVVINAGSGAKPFIYGRARDAAGAQTTITQQHPYDGTGYGVPGTPATGGEYVAIFESTEI